MDALKVTGREEWERILKETSGYALSYFDGVSHAARATKECMCAYEERVGKKQASFLKANVANSYQRICESDFALRMSSKTHHDGGYLLSFETSFLSISTEIETNDE